MITFEIQYEALNLPLIHPFTISRGTRSQAHNVLVRVSAQGVTGIGEAAPNHRYGETQHSASNYLQQYQRFELPEPVDVVQAARFVQGLADGEFAARAALEMALLDWIGKRQGCAVHTLLQAPGKVTPPTTFTIGLDTPSKIAQKIEEAERWPLLKIKLGSSDDRQLIKTVRRFTDKPLMVDANEGWTSTKDALEHIRYLSDQNVFLIEQPMPSSMYKEMRLLRDGSPIPLIADESLSGSYDLDELARGFHGINLKLMKTGGLLAALDIVHAGRKKGLQIMVGCMLESSIANTAAAVLALWADYVDIDSHLLLSNDPWKGAVAADDGRLYVPDLPGLGLKKTAS